jgi:hypothetical protein
MIPRNFSNFVIGNRKHVKKSWHSRKNGADQPSRHGIKSNIVHRASPPERKTISLIRENTHNPIGNTTNMGWSGCFAILAGVLIVVPPELLVAFC